MGFILRIARMVQYSKIDWYNPPYRHTKERPLELGNFSSLGWARSPVFMISWGWMSSSADLLCFEDQLLLKGLEWLWLEWLFSSEWALSFPNRLLFVMVAGIQTFCILWDPDLKLPHRHFHCIGLSKDVTTWAQIQKVRTWIYKWSPLTHGFAFCDFSYLWLTGVWKD